MEDRHMSSKQKGQGNEGRGLAREKGVNVSEDSLQTRSPGSRQSGSADVQSANVEQGSSYLRNRNAEQGPYAGSAQSERGTGQQAGWSSRQQAQRMQARAEEERLAASPGSTQSGAGGSAQSEASQAPASPGNRGSKQGRGGKP
jgi:hypothetical protein